jgi:hypothetical protein
MNAQELKQTIIAKYGSMTRFCRLTGLQSSDMYTRINHANVSREYLEEVFQLVQDTEATEKPDTEITDEQRREMRSLIYQKYHNITAFCEAHPQFTQSWISILLNGKIKRKTRKVKKLISLLHE